MKKKDFKLKIWLIMSGEPLEIFGERPHRIGILSKMLVKMGHDVTWWTTTYDHQYKDYLYNNDKEIVNNEIKMIFLHSNIRYNRNISIDRIKNHKVVSLKFASKSIEKNKPDIIFCAFPTIDLAFEAVSYGKKFNIPVVVDVRDLWPDIFIDPFPNFLHPLIKIFLKRYREQTRYIFRNCTAITGVSQKYLNYGLKYGDRNQSSLDKVFPLAYEPNELKNKVYYDCEEKFNKVGINKNKIIIWFVGTFGKTYDLSIVIRASKGIKNNNIQFVFTGDGENATLWKNLAKDCKNIIFTGWVNKDDLTYLADISDIGLMAYRKGAPQGLPNKVFEYLASGLPIVSSLQSETKELLEKEKVGFTYDADNVESFKESLLKLLKNDELRLDMSNRCKELFENNFSSSKVYNDLREYLEGVAIKYKT